MTSRRTPAVALWGAILLLVAGCTELPGLGRQPTLHFLRPAVQVDPAAPAVTWQLLVESPNAPGTINTGRIALRSPATNFAHFADRRWADPAPVMVQSLLVEAFERSGRIVSVGRDSIGLRADYVLKLDLRDFQAEYTDAPGSAAPEVRVAAAAKLVRMPRREIVAGRTFEARLRAGGSGFDAVLRAFEEASGAVLADIVGWTLTTGEAHREDRGDRPAG